ncbi:MAG: hypothetical protein ACC628_18495 [Pirellulaceae bacterium]
MTAGAIGAHVLEDKLSPKQLETFRMAANFPLMKGVDFSETLWLFASPWSEQQLEHGDCLSELALAWVALWNYTVDPTSMEIDDLYGVCGGLFDIPTDELIEILSKRMGVFFPDDNRLIKSYRVAFGFEEFSIYVTLAEPNG